MWRQGSASPHGTSAVKLLQCWSIVVVSVVLEHTRFTLPVRLACMALIAIEQDMPSKRKCMACQVRRGAAVAKRGSMTVATSGVKLHPPLTSSRMPLAAPIEFHRAPPTSRDRRQPRRV